MNRNERELLRDALAETVSEYEANPTPEGRAFMMGMRYMASILGMPEGDSAFDWSRYEAPREIRRRRILNRLAGLRRT